MTAGNRDPLDHPVDGRLGEAASGGTISGPAAAAAPLPASDGSEASFDAVLHPHRSLSALRFSHFDDRLEPGQFRDRDRAS